jgi:type VI secretion system VasD/TssJ family lipoprotein
LWKSKPQGEWSGRIESHPPGTEVDDVIIVGATSDDGESTALPEGLAGPNPGGNDSSFVNKALELLPFVEPPVTEATPVRNVSNESKAEAAIENDSGWEWDDRSQKWILTAKKIPSTDEWLYESEALLLRFNAGETLNQFDFANHALTLKIIQLDNPKVFNQLRKDSFGITDMLTTTAMDPSFISEQQLFLLPSDDKTLVLDREEGVKYLGLLAGYYELGQYKLVTRLIKIPVVMEALDTGGIVRIWPLKKEVLQRPARLKFWVQLGELKIDNVAVQVY